MAFRDDSRAMWLYVVDTSPQARSQRAARVADFVEELDRRLPRLRCVDNAAVPVKH